MNKLVTRPLKAFLCHASGDKPPVRELYKRLVFEGVDAWLDKEKLLPGQDWRVEIPRAVGEADVVIIFLSEKSVSKEGYVQKEIKFALDIAEEKPEGTIFLIPARLEECVVPERLSRWHWVDLYEENGFIKLLRSLKLRANVVGATVETASYEDSDKEIEHRVEQLYTEGLAAFYTEDWDRACQRFQMILSEHPSHKNAAEKLAEAEKQRSLARSYAQATDGYKAENWQAAIRSLEELLQKSAEYKDAGQLLRNARKQKQLKELYAEAKTLHAAQKWQAVLKVFEQIFAIDPNFPDSDGLLPSAQKEVSKLKRLADLNDLYSHAVREMDAGQWVEARRLLEQVHKAQTGFLETERLLKKVENEIAKVDEHNKRNDRVNMLYEQAHGLIRSKNWRKALDKMEEIQKLTDQFLDKDGISEKAKTELAREEQEIQRQNELAAMYSEAARLLKEGKYQEALDKWQELKTIDPKYPDRQWVQRIARKQLAEMTKPVKVKPRFVMSKQLWAIVALIAIVAAGFILSSMGILNLFPTTNDDVAPVLYDDFNSGANENGFDKSLWEVFSQQEGNTAQQRNGSMVLVSNGYEKSIVLIPIEYTEKNLTSPTFFETSVMLPAQQNGSAGIHIAISGTEKFVFCHIWGVDGKQSIYCDAPYFNQPIEDSSGIDIEPGTWHTLRMELDPAVPEFSFYIDKEKAGKFTPSNAENYKSAMYSFRLYSGCEGAGCTDPASPRVVEGYFDYVRMGAIEDDPMVYDDFDDPAYNEAFNYFNWRIETSNSQNNASQSKGGVMSLVNFGYDNYIDLISNKYTQKTLTSRTFIKSYFMQPPQQNGGTGIVVRINEIGASVICYIWGDKGGQALTCEAVNFGAYEEISNMPIELGSWHTAYIEVDPSVPTFTFYLDGMNVGTYTPPQPERYKSVQYNLFITSFCSGSGCTMGASDMVEGNFDYVEIGSVP